MVRMLLAMLISKIFGNLHLENVDMKKKIIIIISSILLLACGWFVWNKIAATKKNIVVHEEINPYKNAAIKAVILPLEDGTFGYNIYLYNAVLIHQPSRPGLSGNAGFATEEDAMKVAELVIKKIRNNEMPPTVTIEELQELEVL